MKQIKYGIEISWKRMDEGETKTKNKQLDETKKQK